MNARRDSLFRLSRSGVYVHCVSASRAVDFKGIKGAEPHFSALASPAM
jgi:hypothetical protein